MNCTIKHRALAAEHALVDKLMRIFHQCFTEDYAVELVRGEKEPIYLPADGDHANHRIVFAHGYFSSALHEIAHWLIAGEERRQQVDYGYWYVDDGRSASQQLEFEKVEIKPQAIEWILSQACGHRFCLSIDNLNGEYSDPLPFKRAVCEQVVDYVNNGLPARSELLRRCFCEYFSTSPTLDLNDYSLEAI